MTPIAVSTVSESSWLLSNIWWLVLFAMLFLTLIWGGSKAIIASLVIGIIHLLPPPIDQSTPEATALGFARAMGMYDIATAKRYTTRNGRAALEAMENLANMVPEETKQKGIENIKYLRSARCTFRTESLAICRICCTAENTESANDWNEFSQTGTSYTKIDGKWYVEFSKDAGSSETIPDPTPTPEANPNE